MDAWFASLSSWFQSFLYRIGLANKHAAVVLVGLDNAGKTTLLYRLRGTTDPSSSTSFVPTQRAQTVEEIKMGSLTMKAVDLGGHDRVRYMWKEYLVKTDAIVFVVDSADQDRLEEAKVELQGLLGDRDTADVPILLLANKSDLPGSLSESELATALRVTTDVNAHVSDPSKRPCAVFRTSMLNGKGYHEAFKWLADVL